MRSIEDVADVMAAKFPALFGDPERPVPLARGVSDRIAGSVAPDLNEREVRAFLSWWVSRHSYRLALVVGGDRFAPDGSTEGSVSETERRCWVRQVAERLYAQMRSGPDRLAEGVRTIDDVSLSDIMPEIIAEARAINAERSGRDAHRFWPERERSLPARKLMPRPRR